MEKVTEINCETGEVIERDMTSEESDVLAESVRIEQEEQALRQSAIDKFKALGLTDDEISAIIGSV
jgi:hypothetical protein